MLPLYAALACTPERPHHVMDSELVDSGEPRRPPDWSAEQVEAEIDAALALGLPEPRTLMSLFRDFIDTYGDESCPPTPDGVSMPEDSCTASSGAVFGGVGLLTTNTWDEETVEAIGQASFAFTDPDGQTYAGGGGTALSQGLESGSPSWTSSVWGTWEYPPDPGWLGQRPSSDLEMRGRVEADGSRSLQLEGSLGMGPHHLWIEQLDYRPDSCPEGVEARLRVRHPEGPWFDFETEGCAACGTVSFEGQALGEACPQLVSVLEQAVAATGVAW